MTRMGWRVIDSRTGRGMSMATFVTERQALNAIADWTERDRRGKRPDVHDYIPHLAAQEFPIGADPFAPLEA